MFGRIILKTFEFRRSVPRSLNLQRDYVVYVKLCSYADVLPRITVHCNGLCRNSFQTSATTFKVRKTREERQSKNIIQFKPKSKHPTLELWSGITIAEISKLSQRSLNQVFEALSYIATGVEYQQPSSEITDRVMIFELAKKLGYKVSFIKKPGEESEKSETVNDLFRGPKPEPKDLVKRPPVVTIMGHVDHGKTTLLDSLRNTSVAAQEYGGITQHIGAFTVQSSGGVITFLDTPGHAAFQAMRSRGAHATDIVVLVVAADDGIMEQTLESVRFAREANVPIIVAINKIDKAQANIQQIKRDLLTCGLQVEELGGEVQAVCISALKKTNLSSLIETILTQAEVMEISGDPKGPVEGIVLETSIDKGKGKISTALVQRGTLKKGVYLVAGTSWAKIRSMFDNRGKVVTEAMPGIPVQVTGWKSLPQAGDVILQAESEKHAQRVVKYRETLQKSEKAELDSIVIQKKLEQHLEKYRAERQERLMKGRYRKVRKYHRDKEIAIDTDPYLAFVLKGDVHGSVEAIVDVLSTYKSHDDCRLDMVHYAVGDVTENDIVLAESFEGIVYCFNVRIPPAINQLAIDKNVPIKSFNVIYHLIDDLKVEINKRLPLLKEEDILGEAEVLQEFLINEGKKKVHVAGCKCVKGLLKRGAYCKVLRSKEVLYSGSIQSLKHEKTDVDSIKKDVQCGLRLENPDFSFSPGDTILCVEEKYVPRTTDWDPGF